MKMSPLLLPAKGPAVLHNPQVTAVAVEGNRHAARSQGPNTEHGWWKTRGEALGAMQKPCPRLLWAPRLVDSRSEVTGATKGCDPTFFEHHVRQNPRV